MKNVEFGARPYNVCSYEHAVVLKELGVEQTSLFCYSHPKDSYIPNWRESDLYRVTIINGHLYDSWTGYEHYSAYTLYELSVLIGKGTAAAEHFKNSIDKQMNSGCSFTICLDINFVTACVIDMIKSGLIDTSTSIYPDLLTPSIK